jgi:hypothetical protein
MAHRQCWHQGHLPFSGKPNFSASTKVAYVDAEASVVHRARCRFERIGKTQMGHERTSRSQRSEIAFAQITKRRTP